MGKYLVIVNCEDELEKKRVDYVIEKWGIQKVKGFVLKLDELNEDFITEVYSKLVKGNVEIYKLKPVKEEPTISKTRRQFKAYFNKDLGTVDQLIVFMFNKINAVPGGEAEVKSRGIVAMDNIIQRRYSVYVRGKGRVDIDVRLKVKSGRVLAEFTVEGSENAVDSFIVDLVRDLRFFEAEVEL